MKYSLANKLLEFHKYRYNNELVKYDKVSGENECLLLLRVYILHCIRLFNGLISYLFLTIMDEIYSTRHSLFLILFLKSYFSNLADYFSVMYIKTNQETTDNVVLF